MLYTDRLSHARHTPTLGRPPSSVLSEAPWGDNWGGGANQSGRSSARIGVTALPHHHGGLPWQLRHFGVYVQHPAVA